MGLRFLLGKAGSGKSGRCIREIEEKLVENPQGPSILYIVPEQMTFQQERALLNREKINGSIRAQVSSFSHLAQRVLQETGGNTRKFISSTGIQMMLRKITEERTSDWNVFQQAIEKQGFIEQLEGMITEFKRYRISPEMLAAQILEIDQYRHLYPGEKALQGKMEDLHYIYDRLVAALQGKYIDSEDQLQLLTEKVEETDFLNDAEVYLDGFHSFTPQELAVIGALLKKVKRISVTLAIPEAPKEEVSEVDLFFQPGKTYLELEIIAQESGAGIDEIELLNQDDGRFKERPYFAHLEKYFNQRPAPVYKGEIPVQVAEAVHPRAEVEGAAQEILKLVRDEGYRYRDIAVLIRQTDVYHDLVATIFKDHDIPVFIDEKRTMMNHPLLELIRSGLDVVEGNWRYDALFRVLKTGFIPISDPEYPLTLEALDELENYVLEYGIRGRERWLGKEEWVFQRFRGFESSAQTDEERNGQIRINRYRKQVGRAIGGFDADIRNAATIREKAIAIYEWLEKLGVAGELEQIRDVLDEEGRIEEGREQDQVWEAILQLLDEIVEIAGDDRVSLQLFRAALEAGFESLEFAHVPPSMDHVITGTIDRSRISGIKCAFLLGVNEGIWPMKPSAEGMITEEEREILADHGMQLADGSKRQLLDDWFYVYLAFTCARDKLWISYPMSDEEGKTKVPSQLIRRVEELFPSCCNHLLLHNPDETDTPDRFITTPNKTRSALTAQLAKRLRGYAIDETWYSVLNWYIAKTGKTETTSRILYSLFYQNKTVDLAKETAAALYSRQVKTSVSRMETYYRCSYQHFAGYSLSLEDRRMYKLDAPDVGQLFHESLRLITEWIQREKTDFSSVDRKKSAMYASRAVEQLAPIMQHQILHSSNRYYYIKKKLQEVIARAAFVLGEQARQSRFSTIGLELGFGPGQKLPPITIELPNGYELVLRGRIDRVDKAIGQDNLLLRIIDYKSSSKGLNLAEVYYGLALQMLAYLDVVLSNSEQWLGAKADPAGVLYFHVHNPMLSGDRKIRDPDIEKELFKKFKMKGLLVEDEGLAKLMDIGMESGQSEIIPAGLKKDGTFRKGSSTAKPEVFQHLQQYIRSLMQEAGVDITSGKVHLNPYQDKQKSACTHCEFHSICQFDPMLAENKYRRIKDLKDEEVLDAIIRKEES